MKMHKWRVMSAVLLIVAWFAIASFGGPTFGKIESVSTNDQAAFLPASAESTQVQKLAGKFRSNDSLPAVIVLESKQPTQPGDFVKLAQLTPKFAEVPGVNGKVVGPIPSQDKLAVQWIVPLQPGTAAETAVKDLRKIAAAQAPGGWQAYVAGPAGFLADLTKAFAGIDGILLFVALAAVLIILLVVYRSVLLPLLVLLNAVFALSAAILAVYIMAKHGVIKVNGQSQGILSILVIGAATDYSLLLIARYREALSHTADKWEAIMAGVRGVFEPVLASAVTVILALLCLLISDLNSNRSLGPVAAVGIMGAFVATLTFLAPLLAVFGRKAFWPSKIRTDVSAKTVRIRTGTEELQGIWLKVATLLQKRARTVWLVVVIVLAAASLGLTQLKAGGVPQSELILGTSNAADGQAALARHFDAGSAVPVLVAAPADNLPQTLAVLHSDSRFGMVLAYGDNGRLTVPAYAKQIDGKVLLSTDLRIDPYSASATTAVRELRQSLHAKQTGAEVGGTTALSLDTNETAAQDLKHIIPLVLMVIFIVLALLLRSLLAPLLLIFTVVLSFAATLGISALVFNHLFHFPGADPAVPLFGFVFLVALGVDYNIFLVTRTREESFKYGTRPAVLHSLGKTGGVITSAGVVLAATFAALGVIPILFLAQIAFIVAFGVLLDTVVVRSLLVPALLMDIGRLVWWPSRKLQK